MNTRKIVYCIKEIVEDYLSTRVGGGKCKKHKGDIGTFIERFSNNVLEYIGHIIGYLCREYVKGKCFCSE
jgi:hypothetical protein